MELKHQAFFYSLFLSRLADQILLFLVPLVIFQLTGSVAWSGAAFLLETLPRYLSFPICGVLCDRKSPLALLHISQQLRAVACFAGMIAYAGFGGIGWLIGISVACGVLTTQGLMAREVLLPQVFHRHRFEKVASYTQIADQLGMVLGPLVAAGLLKLWSWEYVVISTTALFMAADGAMIIWQRFVRPTLAEPTPAPSGWTLPLKTALRHVIGRPGLVETVLLAAAVNLIIGVTLATSAAMVTGVHGETDSYYAVLQAAGAIATVVILFATAHAPASLQVLGVISYAMIFAGGAVSGLASHAHVYALGFVLVVGFDKMFSVFIRSLRMKIIPREDLGKTTGLIIMLNNLSQPLAGLLVSVFAGRYGAGTVIVALSLFMGLLGPLVAAIWLRRTAPTVRLDQR
ncbi:MULTISPECIES: MFS transporter [Bradyrhizobium]|uniref:MFS transporter n=1 Tax=Bradyrhizobium TaxID=374 RepID=UPI001553E135|nr:MULTISPECIES: MFS transporter [Bradyrhizobium]NPU09883.1 MFS transporter [Bradyrhizobium aeschynomenes]